MKRRSMLAGLLGAALGATPGRRLLAQSGQPEDLAGCLAEPGIALFLDLFQGRSNLTSQELLPGADWQLYSSPSTLVSFSIRPIGLGRFCSLRRSPRMPRRSGRRNSRTHRAIAASILGCGG